MNIRDLILGDYVNFLIDIEGGNADYDPKVAQYQPMKIVSLSSWHNNDGEVESAEGVINDIDQVKPIPLTPEILEKNGFIGDKNVCKTKVRDDSKDELWQCEYAWYLKNLRIKNRTNGSVARLYNIMFVHELQHALRLCGINKEIKI